MSYRTRVRGALWRNCAPCVWGSVCVCVSWSVCFQVPCPARPSCLPSDFICIFRLQENHVFVLKVKSVTMTPITARGKWGEQDKGEKIYIYKILTKEMKRMMKEKKREASLMYPAKIFRLLPHYASPCPTHTHNPTWRHTTSHSPLRSESLTEERTGARGHIWPVLNFLLTPFSNLWLVNNLELGIRREIQWMQEREKWERWKEKINSFRWPQHRQPRRPKINKRRSWNNTSCVKLSYLSCITSIFRPTS